MPGISFRRIEPGEVKILQDISLSTFIDAFAHQNNPEDFKLYLSKAFSLEKLSSELADANSLFYFITSENEKAGYLKLNVDAAQTEQLLTDSMEIERIYVINRYQGKGIGKVALDFVTQLARELGKKWIWLGVWEKNIDARRFYESHGFTSFSSHIYMVGNDAQTDLLMKKNLQLT